MNKVLMVTGANGQLATEYRMSPVIEGWDVYFLDRHEMDITDLESIAKNMKSLLPDCVLNLAAYTNVEKAEKEQVDECFKSNAVGPKNLALACNKTNIPLIHISTDYVFDGNSLSAYTEKSVENPINNYGRTKFLGEKWIQEVHDWYYILRVSWVYSNHSKNFYTTMLKMAQERNEVNVVNDQFGSPTSTKEICRAIDLIINNLDKKNTGVYHFSGMGKTTWKDFTEEIFKQIRVNVKVKGVPSSSWPSVVKRPQDTYMTSEKFAKIFGTYPPHWKNSLREIIAESKIIPIKVGDLVMLNKIQHVIVTTDWINRIARISPIDNIEDSKEIPFDLLII